MMASLMDKYLPYWPVLAGALLFLILGLWLHRAAATAMERSPKDPDWVRNYRSGGFPFRKKLLPGPEPGWLALTAVVVAAALLAAGRLACGGMIFLNRPELFFRSSYGLYSMLLWTAGGACVYFLLNLLFNSTYVGLLGGLLFAASPAEGHGEASMLALSALLLLLYLRMETPGFRAELLYLAAILVLAPAAALRHPLILLLPCYLAAHWYKLRFQLRKQDLSGGKLAGMLALALVVWVLVFVLAAILRRWLMFGFRTRELVNLMNFKRIRYACSELLRDTLRTLYVRPTRGMTLNLMLDAPLFGLGFWGLFAAWTMGVRRRSVRGLYPLLILAALTLVWLISSRYALSLGLVLAAGCVLKNAELGKRKALGLIFAILGICWYIAIQIAAWSVPLPAGILERLV
ncbi:MAG: hypothetical protein IKS05_05215 [Oscillospiraceae bacterium]|nr:hypothetical protein [Oscillospiraceae bacterium]